MKVARGSGLEATTDVAYIPYISKLADNAAKIAFYLIGIVVCLVWKAIQEIRDLIIGSTLFGYVDKIVFPDRIWNVVEQLVNHSRINVHAYNLSLLYTLSLAENTN
jgi:hypothetical protein